MTSGISVRKSPSQHFKEHVGEKQFSNEVSTRQPLNYLKAIYLKEATNDSALSHRCDVGEERILRRDALSKE